MYKAYKFRMYPNKEQQVTLNKNFGCSRFVYNHYLDENQNKKYINAYNCINDYRNNLSLEYPFLKEVDNNVVGTTLKNLENNFKRYQNNNFGCPKFKSKFGKNSYTILAIHSNYKNKQYCNIEVDLINRNITLPKLNKITIKGYRNETHINGKIKRATISKEPNGKYYVSVMVELPEPLFIKPLSIVGIDLGIKNLLTLSDGTIIPNNKYIEKYEKRIKRLQKELSRKVKGSKNYYKCKQKLNILYTKLKNARKYYIHQITKTITDTYDIITCEKLSTKKMIMEKQISKQISDASFYEIIKELEYKSKFKGKYFYQIDTYYASSQICSKCDNKSTKYKNLNERTYNCQKCGNTIDRDLNASINIMSEGLKLFMKDIVL